ncbi:MAG: helix-turn-helix transcriptional regulator [Crocinitomicaceae bacterium]|nr:helix-turn-helix transcriptional regulator [Crocinitomicaceae bacterium]
MKNTLKIQRAIHSLTQEELANKVGVSRQTINSIEKGKYIPSTSLALKISLVFCQSVNELFQLEEND